MSLRGREGMTLLELVVALLITGIAVAGGYAAFGALVDQRGHSERATDDVMAATAMRTELREWLAGAHLTSGGTEPTFRGLDGIRDRRPDDALEFETIAPTPLAIGVTRVRLAIDRDADTPEQGLVATFTDPVSGRVTRTELVGGAESFQVRYLGRIAGGRSWLESWISGSLLPVGVEIRVGGAPERPLGDLWALPITLPVGGGA